ncbi:actin-like protein [Trypanosoma grayi]|uniref:actin-like protein n=1 Tax=Trypanosoma grayi TaxID=71804 RepID=UPI0004F4343A|nr:actin-like protein [Trypanosoma grayi]KEG06160.1 actin-like protein [Trypanosoma grayi]
MSGAQPVLVIDNGGYTLKALYIPDVSNTTALPPRQVVVPNCVGAASFAGRGIVGEQLFKLPHFHGFMLRRPVDRGFVVDAALQSYIWEYLLQYFAIADESDVELVLTVPFAAPKQVGELLHYLVAQRFTFRAVTLVSATFLALVAAASRECLHGCTSSGHNEKVSARRSSSSSNNNNCDSNSGIDGGCGIVVDFGFSATTVVPYIDFLPVREAAVRIDVGGKLLANRLKEHISFTQVNMAEDGWLVNHIMERCCHVALDPLTSLRTAQRQKRRSSKSSSAELRYYLPTVPPLMPLGCREEELHAALASTASGDALGQERHLLQHLVFRHEAFVIPELLFHPVDVGIQQMGVVEAIVCGSGSKGPLRHAPTLHEALQRHIVAFGGTAKFPQLRDRLNSDLRKELARTSELAAAAAAATSTLSSSSSVPATAAEAEANETITEPLQQLVERSRMAPGAIDTNQNAIGYSPHDSELQPLYGALALLTSPLRQSQLHLVQSRSRVDLTGLRTMKTGMRRMQGITAQKTQKALQDALHCLL